MNAPTLEVSYAYSAETTLTDVRIQDRRITYTYNVRNSLDKPGRPNVAQQPHYTNRDMKVESAQLTQTEERNLFKTIRASGFLKLKQPAANPRRRAYPETISVRMGMQSATYAHTEGRAPAAFRTMREAIKKLVSAHFTHKMV